MTWMRVTLSDRDINASKSTDLQKRFFVEFAAAGTPTAAIMYGWWKARDRGHYYFTPAAAMLASGLMTDFGGVPCAKPDLDGLAVMVGTGAWDDRV